MFSSSATVYGDPQYLPLDEKHPVGGCTNPYGKSKYFIEEMIQDLCKAKKVRGWSIGVMSQCAGVGVRAATSLSLPRAGTPFSCAILIPLVPMSLE